MTARPRPVLATALLTAMLAVTASIAQAQDPTSGAEPEATPSNPGLVQRASAATPATICGRSGGSLTSGAPALCELPTEAVTDEWIVETFGSEQEAYVLGAFGGPSPLSGPVPEGAPNIDRISFIPSIELSPRATRRLGRRERAGETGLAKGRTTDWEEAGTVGIVTLHFQEPTNLRRASRGGAVVARLRSGDRAMDVSYVDRTLDLTRADGRRSDGMVVVGRDRIDFFVPGGLDPFTARLLVIDGDGNASGQVVAGPGGPEAQIPLAPYPPVVACASALAHVDPDNTTDGLTYGLDGMTLTFSSPRIPAGVDGGQLDLDLTLAPDGSRAGRDLPDLDIGVIPDDEQVRQAIAIDVDMNGLGLVGETGYHFGQLPYRLVDLSGRWEAPTDAPTFDPGTALALLEEAGWTRDGEDAVTSDLSDVALEFTRIVGPVATDSPIHWGWTGCGQDAHWPSIQDPCLGLDGDGIRDDIGRLLGEPPETLAFETGSFAPGFTGCSVFGEGDAFLGMWLLGETYGPDAAYDAAVLAPFGDFGCEIEETRSPGFELDLVGRCPDASFEIFHDGSHGFDTYWAFANVGLDAELLAPVIEAVADVDLDGDGVLDRFDEDVDGDGLQDDIDPDDDGDGVPDDRDHAPFDPDIYTSPDAFGEVLDSLEAATNR